MKYAVTLKKLREEGACYSVYNKVVRSLQGKEFTNDDEERESYIRYVYKGDIPLIDILNSNGFEDTLWCLRCIPDFERDARLFAEWCARQVNHLMTDERSIAALDIAEHFANGRATEEERAAAWSAARAAAWSAARDAQKEMFINMLNGEAPWQ